MLSLILIHNDPAILLNQAEKPSLGIPVVYVSCTSPLPSYCTAIIPPVIIIVVNACVFCVISHAYISVLAMSAVFGGQGGV